MIIIPRGDYTYSFHSKEIIKRGDMKKALLNLTKERYTNELNENFIFKTTKKSDVFCFNAESYIKKAKEENRNKKREKKIYVSNKLIDIFSKNLTAGKIGLSIKVDKDLNKDDRLDAEKEKRKALLVSKFVNTCRDSVSKRKDE